MGEEAREMYFITNDTIKLKLQVCWQERLDMFGSVLLDYWKSQKLFFNTLADSLQMMSLDKRMQISLDNVIQEETNTNSNEKVKKKKKKRSSMNVKRMSPLVSPFSFVREKKITFDVEYDQMAKE